MTEIGIEAIGTYIPEERHTAEYISSQSGTPAEIIKTKMGMVSKSVPGPDDHTVAMGVKAAKIAIERAGIDPTKDIDLVKWPGEVYAAGSDQQLRMARKGRPLKGRPLSVGWWRIRGSNP